MGAAKKYSAHSKIIDTIGLSAIGFFCLCYAIFWSNFAELHISLPFLDFPIFIGELLLAVCLVLLAVKCILVQFRLNKWHYLLCMYIVWVLAKAFLGYREFGPVSFRNAALFYYPLFAVISYHLYRSEYFNQRILILLLLIFAIAQLAIEFSPYFFFPSFVLFLAMAIKIKKRWVKYLACVALFCLFSYKNFFQGDRSIIVANTAAFLFLISFFIFGIVKMRRWHKALILFLMLGFLAFGFLRLAASQKIKSLATPAVLIEQFRHYDEAVREKQEYFKPREIAVQLYNPNTNTTINSDRIESIDRQARSLLRKYTLLYIEKIKQQPSMNFEGSRKFYEKHRVYAMQAALGGSVTDLKNKFKEYKKQEAEALKQLIDDMSVELVACLAEYKEKLVEAFKTSIRGQRNKVIYEGKIEEISRNYRELLQKKYEIAKEKISVSSRILKEGPDSWNKRLNIIIQDAQATLEEERVLSLNQVLDFRISDMVSLRNLGTEYDNILFRLFIWRDMFDELMREKPWFGFSFGKPQRSISLEILKKGFGDWGRDGWIAAHNSFFHIIYRAGILGILMIMGVLVSMSYLTIKFIKLRSFAGLLLISILLYWIVIANFAVVLELPYQAIPFWSLWGITFAYLASFKKAKEHR